VRLHPPCLGSSLRSVECLTISSNTTRQSWFVLCALAADFDRDYSHGTSKERNTARPSSSIHLQPYMVGGSLQAGNFL
jgi:hypothetical protein